MQSAYFLPVRVTFGSGCLERLPSLACIESAQRIVVVIGGTSVHKSGAFDRLMTFLAGKDIRVINGIPPEPGLEDLERMVESFRSDPPDCIVAIGGGSVMDTAKAANFCAAQAGDPRVLLVTPPADPHRPIPLVAIPTTAGTGSEVTPFTVFWQKAEKKKFSLHHPLQYPTEALVDPLLTHSMPPAVTASTGMDAFTQACEAYWNRNHNPLSDDYALSAVRRILSALPEAVANGNDATARHEVMLGSLQAGLAFSNTRTAACHSISYPMTLHYNVMHGQAVGITLPPILERNEAEMPDRAARFCHALGVTSVREAADAVRAMMCQCGLKTRLSELGIDDAGIDVIVKEGFTPERMGNNPYLFTADSLRQMLTEIA